MPESFSREVPEGSKAPKVYGKRNPDAVIEARQKRLYRRQLSGLPARQLVLDHCDRESVCEATGWKDWKVVQSWNDAGWEDEKASILSRVQSMRMNIIEKSIKAKNFQTAIPGLEHLARTAGIDEPGVGDESVKLNIQIEKKQ